MNVLNKISKFLCITVCIIICGIGAYRIHFNSQPTVYNYVELSAKYKRCAVVDKNKENDDKYYLVIENLFTNKRTKVYVTENIYYNVYFIGDYIK